MDEERDRHNLFHTPRVNIDVEGFEDENPNERMVRRLDSDNPLDE